MWLDDDSDRDNTVSPQVPPITTEYSAPPEALEFDATSTVEDPHVKRARLLRELAEVPEPVLPDGQQHTTYLVRRDERLIEEFRVAATESLRTAIRGILEAARVYERATSVSTITAAEADAHANRAHAQCGAELATLSQAFDRAHEALKGSMHTRELVLLDWSDPSGHAACVASEDTVEAKIEAVTDRIACLTESKQADLLSNAGTIVSVQAGSVSHTFWTTRQQHRQAVRLELSDRLQNHLNDSQARSIEAVDSLHARRTSALDSVSAQIAKAAADLQQRMSRSTSDLIRSTQAVVTETALAADDQWKQKKNRLELLHSRMVDNAGTCARDLENTTRQRFAHETLEMNRLYRGNVVGSVVARSLPSIEFRPPTMDALPAVPEFATKRTPMSEPFALTSLDGLRAALRHRRSAQPEFSELCTAATDASSALDFTATRLDLEKIAGVHRQWLAECRGGQQPHIGSEELAVHSAALEPVVELASKVRSNCDTLRSAARSAASEYPSETPPELGGFAVDLCKVAGLACAAVKGLVEASAAAAVEHGKLSAEALILEQLRSESMDRQRAAKERLQRLAATLLPVGRSSESAVQSSALDQTSSRYAESQASTRLESLRSGYAAEASS